MTHPIATEWNSNTGLHTRIAYAGSDLKELVETELNTYFQITFNDSLVQLEEYLGDQSILTIPEIILLEVDENGDCFELVERLKKNFLFNGMIIVLLSLSNDKDLKLTAMKLKVHDFYIYPFSMSDLRERLNFLVKFKLIKPKLNDITKEVDTEYKIPIGKRMIDLVISGTMLLILSPIMLAVAIAVKLNSKGPIIYKSKRVGTGYKVFDFYKFRSMRTDADKMLVELSTQNQYANEDGGTKAAFVKIKNDPRVTKLGNFLRNSSLDELPQLVNILLGHMSLVGNRPLPVYEAEMLTSNEWSMRFLGPAGLTGLWQITKRGKLDMSERERKKLDNFYAQNYSFWLDMKILVRTVPALLQKEKFKQMNNKCKTICLSLIILTFATNIHAQETIFKDLSYTYLEKLIAAAKQNYPRVKILQDQINIAKSSFHQASFTWLDAFSASYIYSPENKTATSATNPIIFNGLQLVATVSLGSLFERPYTVHNARVAVKVAEEQQEEYFLTIEANVKRFYFAYIEAQADLRNKVNAVQDATTSVSQLKHTFEKGETTFQVYNEALTNLYNQNSFRLQAELAVFTAKTNLEELLGAKLESIK